MARNFLEGRFALISLRPVVIMIVGVAAEAVTEKEAEVYKEKGWETASEEVGKATDKKEGLAPLETFSEEAGKGTKREERSVCLRHALS